MATMEMDRRDRSNLWEVTSRTIVYAAIGAALYGVLGLFDFLLPGTTNVSIRPAFSLVAFFGYAFGPVAGLFVGLVGNAITDQLHGYGFLTYWNWSLANGLAGLIAGLAALYASGFVNSANIRQRAIGGAIAGVVGSIIGFLFVFSDVILSGTSVGTQLTTAYIPVVIADVITTAILVPVLVYAWEPVKAQLGR
jgi:energy-coupling factor transport system substrate-specific component